MSAIIRPCVPRLLIASKIWELCSNCTAAASAGAAVLDPAVQRLRWTRGLLDPHWQQRSHRSAKRSRMSTSIISGIISKYFQHLQQAFKKHQKHQKPSKGDTENLGINAVQAHRRTFQDSQEYQWQQALDSKNWVRHPICFPTSKWDQTVLTRTKGPSRT